MVSLSLLLSLFVLAATADPAPPSAVTCRGGGSSRGAGTAVSSVVEWRGQLGDGPRLSCGAAPPLLTIITPYYEVRA